MAHDGHGATGGDRTGQGGTERIGKVQGSTGRMHSWMELSPLPAEPPCARPTPTVQRRAELSPLRRISASRRLSSPRASSASSPCARPSAALSFKLSSAASPRAASAFSRRLRASASSFFSWPRESSRLRDSARSRCWKSASFSASLRCSCWSWGAMGWGGEEAGMGWRDVGDAQRCR